MTRRPCSLSSNAARQRCAVLAIIAALTVILCDAPALARPRSWADQDAAPLRQPAWMPFSIGDRTPHPAVARITAVEGNTLSQGSGTLVEVRDQRGLVVTNWHVIRNATGPIVATFPDGSRSAATVLKVDRDWDLAALLIWRPPAAPIAISTIAPRPGDPLTIAGYGSGNYRAAIGRCTQYVAPGAQFPYEMVEVSVEARQGDSGGPILNQRGELAGVLFGAAGGTTSGAFCGRVRFFLDSAWPAEQFQEADTLVSVPVLGPNTHWPTDPTVALPRFQTTPERTVIESTPNYSVGSILAPATVSTRPLREAENAVNLSTLTGTTPLEQAKTILASIGILAVLLQLSRIVRPRAKKTTVKH